VSIPISLKNGACPTPLAIKQGAWEYEGSALLRVHWDIQRFRINAVGKSHSAIATQADVPVPIRVYDLGIITPLLRVRRDHPISGSSAGTGVRPTETRSTCMGKPNWLCRSISKSPAV